MARNLKNAFSLMEMMVVLLIVAIIAAASAPMVTKKMARNAGTGDSPWVFTGLGDSIAYNIGGNDASALIGTSTYSRGDRGPTRPRLVIASGNDTNHPALAFATSNGTFSGQINMNSDIGVVTMNDATVGNNSVAVGMRQALTNNPSNIVAIGSQLDVQDDEGIAIGHFAMSHGQGSISIGRYAQASGRSSIAIGRPGVDPNESTNEVGTRTCATADGAIAIGRGAQATDTGAICIASTGTSRTWGSETPIAQAMSDSAIAIGPAAVVGDDAYASVALGRYATALGKESVAIGKAPQTESPYSIGIGHGVRASGERSIAIGHGAQALHAYSIAIGAGDAAQSYERGGGTNIGDANANYACTTRAHQIVLGTNQDTVYVPGNLVVGKNVIVNIDDTTSRFIFRNSINTQPMCVLCATHYDGVDSDIREYSTVNMEYDTESLYNTYSSDRRLKNVGESYTAGLEALKKLEFFHYTFKKDDSKTPRVGVMAQDLQKVFPDAVTKGDDGFLRIRWEDMFYAVINAVKELDTKISTVVKEIAGVQETIKAQQAQIDELQKQNTELQKQNVDLEKRIEKLENALKDDK